MAFTLPMNWSVAMRSVPLVGMSMFTQSDQTATVEASTGVV